MTRLARYLAGWLMSKHVLALDAAQVAEERDRWEVEARAATKAAERAVDTALSYAKLLAEAQGPCSCGFHRQIRLPR